MLFLLAVYFFFFVEINGFTEMELAWAEEVEKLATEK